METKDWLYFFGLLLTFGVSVTSLLINIKNRRNAIREHLFKEQFLQLQIIYQEFRTLIDITPYIYVYNRINAEEKHKDFFIQLEKIKSLVNNQSLIIPAQLMSVFNKCTDQAYDLVLLWEEKKGNVGPKDGVKFTFAYFDICDEIREFIGVDKLSDENRKLIGSKEV